MGAWGMWREGVKEMTAGIVSGKIAASEASALLAECGLQDGRLAKRHGRVWAGSADHATGLVPDKIARHCATAAKSSASVRS